jgi:hypothetical protein
MATAGYAERRPHRVPTNLGALTGPTRGRVELPQRLAWTGRREYNLDDELDVVVLYERIIVEALDDNDLSLLSGEVLTSTWSRLYLPARVRVLWQTRFPQLAAAA